VSINNSVSAINSVSVINKVSAVNVLAARRHAIHGRAPLMHFFTPHNDALMCKMHEAIVTDKDVEGDEKERHPVGDCSIGGDIERPSQDIKPGREGQAVRQAGQSDGGRCRETKAVGELDACRQR
jgi:hypothetical protein